MKNYAKQQSYVDVISQKLEREGGSLSTDVAVCYVRLDAQDTPRVVRRHDGIRLRLSKLCFG
jgi:hypothetical protein